jgi:adenine-specific DNA-methyltransferase
MVKTQIEGPLSRRERDRERGSKLCPQVARKKYRRRTLFVAALRARRLAGYKFRRQVIMEPYIVDSVCLEAKLVIVVDGGQHSEQKSYDFKRSARLEGMGYRVLRFWNHEILHETQAVLEQIGHALVQAPSSCPSPGRRRDPPLTRVTDYLECVLNSMCVFFKRRFIAEYFCDTLRRERRESDLNLSRTI